MSSSDTNLPGLDPKALDRFSASLQADIDNGLLYGASVIIARHGKIGLQKTFGTVDPEGRAPSKDDVYFMMSVSKSFTAALMMHAIDQGRFTLDTKVASVLPEFGVKGKQNVTIRHLLTHTAGTFPGMLPPGLPPTEMGNLEKLVKAVAAQPAAFKPGEQCHYNAAASYAILAQMLVATDPAKRTWSQIAREDLFEPLGMDGAHYGIDSKTPGLVPVCFTPKNQTPTTPDTQRILSSVVDGSEVPAGGAWAPIQDVFRFAEMARGRGTIPGDGTRYISRATYDYAAQNHTGDMINGAWEFERAEKSIQEPFVANFTLLGGYTRGEGHILTGCGFTASPRTIYAVGGGTTMWMVDPDRDLTFVFLSCGFIEGLSHFARLRRLSDLALAACE